MLGAVAIAVMLIAPKGLWGFVADRFGWQMFPLARHVVRLGRSNMVRAESKIITEEQP
ncbi:MAG: hypothetical protein R3D52_03335 [Xanthobacteraceae bacterium]